MQPGFLVVILPRKPQIEDEVAQPGRILIRQAVTEGFGLPAPYYPIVVGPGNFSGRAQMIGMDVVDVGCGGLVGVAGFSTATGRSPSQMISWISCPEASYSPVRWPCSS